MTNILSDVAISLAGSAITWIPAVIWIAGFAEVCEAIKSFGGDFKRAMRDARVLMQHSIIGRKRNNMMITLLIVVIASLLVRIITSLKEIL